MWLIQWLWSTMIAVYVMAFRLNWHSWRQKLTVIDHCPANKEPFLNQLAGVILVHNWYRSTSTCFHVYSCEYTCSACCHEFWTSLTRVVLGQNWYGFTGTCHHVKKLVISHTKFVNRIWWIHVNWTSWTREITYGTGEITGPCLLGGRRRSTDYMC